MVFKKIFGVGALVVIIPKTNWQVNLPELAA
jgi:hypothetical protein